MADLDALLAEFEASYLAGGGADVTRFLERVPASERQELATMLDSFLMGKATRRPWDSAAYEGSLAKEAVERVYESTEGVSGTWPELLPRLRAQARIKRSDLVERLAKALGFGDEASVARIGEFYHRMEHGTLPSRGVSPRVVGALASLVGASPDEIRDAGGTELSADGGSGAAFARTARPDSDFVAEMRDREEASPERERSGDLDEIDSLFLDG